MPHDGPFTTPYIKIPHDQLLLPHQSKYLIWDFTTPYTKIFYDQLLLTYTTKYFMLSFSYNIHQNTSLWAFANPHIKIPHDGAFTTSNIKIPHDEFLLRHTSKYLVMSFYYPIHQNTSWWAFVNPYIKILLDEVLIPYKSKHLMWVFTTPYIKIPNDEILLHHISKYLVMSFC